MLAGERAAGKSDQGYALLQFADRRCPMSALWGGVAPGRDFGRGNESQGTLAGAKCGHGGGDK